MIDLIGGNVTAKIQVNQGNGFNAIGEHIEAWNDVDSIVGFLDFMTGDSKHTTYNAKIQESTHVFVADYKPLNSSISAENSRMEIEGKRYEIMVIDDPMNLHEHYEIFLKYTGGQ